jgi:hypothetical protein
MAAALVFAFLLFASALAMTPPANFGDLECAVNKFAYLFASKRVHPDQLHFVHDALNIDQLCTASDPEIDALLHAARNSLGAYEPLPTMDTNTASPTFYVAVSGSDSAPGTLNAPFATLRRAQAATRAASCTAAAPCYVMVRGGKYYLGDAGGTLALGPADSNVVYSSYPGEIATLSGATRLKNLSWVPYSKVPGAFMAKVGIRDPRAEAWRAAHDKGRAGPPPLVGDLFVNGVRQVRARYPNGNPQDNSGICFSATQRPGEGCKSYSSCAVSDTGMQPSPAGHTINNIGPNRGNSPTFGCPQCASNYGTFEYTIYPPPPGHPVYNKPLPSSGWPNASVWDYWSSIFSRPAGVIVRETCEDWAKLDLSNATDAVVHMFHNGLWGGWMYAVDDITVNRNLGKVFINFGYGGYQEARGGGIDAGQHFFLENMLSLLDAPGEWFYDGQTMFVYPNTSSFRDAEFAVPVLDAAITIMGADARLGLPASNITVKGFVFTETRYTYLEQYEVPSGGDWSIHRGGAIFVENAQGISISGNTFNQTGGNAVFFSNHVAKSTIGDNHFMFIGDSAIALQGSAVLNDGSQPIYPTGNLVTQNHIHETGVFGKQTSCIYLSLVANTTVTNNVCYNGPRAHINQNDGFAGGNILQGNLLFNGVRETGDHGNYNSWDRQPYWTLNGVVDGFRDTRGRSYIKAWDSIQRNFIINGYNGVWTIDHDDGRLVFFLVAFIISLPLNNG